MAKKLQVVPQIAPSKEERKAAIDRVVQGAAKKFGGGHVERAEHVRSNYLLRRPSGLLSLDLAMAGGFPAGAPSVIVGPDGAGKDYMLWRTMAETQKVYGDEFCSVCFFTEFKPDKLFMKDICGFQIALSEDELGELDQARHSIGVDLLSATELDHYRHQVGDFISIFGISADHGFDQIFEFLKTNLCQIIAVNSIGFMQTEAKEKTDSYEEFAQQRNEAALLSKVLPQFAMYLNQFDEYMRPNETSLLLVNQVRSKDGAARTMPGRIPQDKDKYETASKAWALKHGKALELFIHNGPKIWDEDIKQFIGRKKSWEISKGKLGTHEGLKGEFDFYHGVGADMVGDVVNVAVKMGIIETAGAWYNFEDGGFKLKTQGLPRLLDAVNKNPEMIAYLKGRCFKEAAVPMRHR